MNGMSEMVQIRDGSKDFDFLHGRWTVHNRYLRERLSGSDDWAEFSATASSRPLLEGIGNEDEFRTDHEGGFIGMAFRFYDRESGRWSIYWADTRRCGVLDPPVSGSFSGDIGLFYGTDRLDGRPILVRFTWTGVTTRTPRWEQAFSDDDGLTWETNWVMSFTPAEDDR
jgi:hypothetical protein